MADHLTRIFWGLLIVGLDVQVYGAVDVLPDGFGYLVIVTGAGGLADHSTSFARARTLGLVLATLWLLGLAPLGVRLGMLLTTLTSTLDVVCLWLLPAGVAGVARGHERADLPGQAIPRPTRDLAVAIGMGLLMLLTPLTRGFELLAPLIAIGGLLVMAGVLQVIYRVRVAVAS